MNACCKDVYPNVFILLKIKATVPVSSCEPECMFSKVVREL